MIGLQSRNMTEFANVYNLLGGGTGLTQQQRAALTSANATALNGALPPFVETFKDAIYPTATWTVVQPLFLGANCWRPKLMRPQKSEAPSSMRNGSGMK